MAKDTLSPEEMARYNRHLRLADFGLPAQLRLKAARVLLIGAGGLGCPLGLYLAASGVGHIGVVDFDRVEISNLQRQIAHKSADAGMNKARSLTAAMSALNPSIECLPYERRLSADWVEDLFSTYDLIIDGTDNYRTRYLVADACYLGGKPLIYGAIHRFEAQLSVFVPGVGPCYRCLFPVPPNPGQTPSCDEAGVLGVLPGVVGVMMATEAIKLISKTGHPLTGKLLLYNALDQSTRHIRLERDRTCPLCGDQPSITYPREEKFPSCAPEAPSVDVTEARRLKERGVLFLDVRDQLEWETCHLSGALHIPLDRLKRDALAEVPTTRELVVYCHKGIRSRSAVALLRDWGYEKGVSMEGGIDAWARAIEPAMVRY